MALRILSDDVLIPQKKPIISEKTSRSKNPDFIKLCLNENLSSEITLQPLKRFRLDAAIIFSDILMLPYGLGQKVEFEKNFGPKLGEINLEKIKN